MQVADDGGQGGGHHGLVQGGQEHPQHQRADDHQHPAVGHVSNRFGYHRGRGRLSHSAAPRSPLDPSGDIPAVYAERPDMNRPEATDWVT